MSVQLPCSLRNLRTESYGARAGIGLRTVHVRGLCNATYDMSTGYGLTIFFKFVKLLAKPNRRGRGVRESVQKSHSRLLPPQGGLAEAARKGGYGQDTGSVDPSQAKCELGINKNIKKKGCLCPQGENSVKSQKASFRKSQNCSPRSSTVAAYLENSIAIHSISMAGYVSAVTAFVCGKLPARVASSFCDF